MNKVTSEKSAASSGVPQSATLEPLLFMIYTIDLRDDSVKKCSVAAYVDHKHVYEHFKIETFTDAENAIKSELNKIQHLSEEHNFLLNFKKKCVICFGKEVVEIANHTIPVEDLL